MAGTTDKPWDGSSSRYKDAEAFCNACLIDDNPTGAKKTVALCKLPIYEPDGTLNLNAVRNARARVNQVQGPGRAKAQAKLNALAKQHKLGPYAEKSTK